MLQLVTMKHNNLLTETTRKGRARWLTVPEVPFSRSFTYHLINDGILHSVELKRPGRRKGIRLVDADSLDKYLEQQSKKPFATNKYDRDAGKSNESARALRNKGGQN